MSKHNNLVQIPVGYVCIPGADFFNMKFDNCNQFKQLRELRAQIEDLEEHINNLEVDLAASEAKVSNLEKELNEKQDRVLYWYQKYTDLFDKLNTVKDHAETEEA